jgi:hypothetical protein
MKRIVLILLLQLCLLSFPSCGNNEREEKGKDKTEKEKMDDKKEAVDVPKPVSDSFTRRYPSAHHIEWDNATENGQPTYKVKFRNAGKKLKAEFAPDGKFIKEKEPDAGDEKEDNLKK